MNKETLFKKSLLVASIALVTACSGGGDTGTTSSSTTMGTVTGFGSVYVNGVEYHTDSAYIEDDDSPVAETSLDVGDVCVVEGTVNPDGVTGNATSVICSDELEGYVLSVNIDPVDGAVTLNVMGQDVTITADTIFDSDTHAAITDLAVNDIVEVYGYQDGLGNILATRVETKSAADDVEVKGLIAYLDTTAMTFSIGGLTVDYTYANIEVNGGLADGLYVEVKTSSPLTGTTMHASKVELEDDGDLDIDGDEGDEIEVQGMVSGLIPGVSFLFNGTLVEFASLEIDEDFDVNTLANGMMITVEGYIDANGNFVVEEIEEDHASEMEAEGFVVSTTANSVTITLYPAVTGETKTFQVNNETRMRDEQDEGVVPLHYFSLADVAIGDFVEIDYYEVDDGNGTITMIATKLERDDAPSVSVTTP